MYSINQLDISHASALLASRPLTSNVHIASTLIGAAILRFNPLSLMSDQDRISPNNINTIPSIQVMRITKNINKGNKLIQYQILQNNITRTVWQTVRRITNEILRVKGLKYPAVLLLYFHISKIHVRLSSFGE